FWALVFFVVGTCIYSVYDQQFPVYFASQFATLREGNAMFGYLNSFQVFLEAGKMRSEGKDYIVKDGDVMNFLFNV
ncbi:DUF933 domain-containing protein, partial [Hafnia alvei]